jgi:hypothetical protein
MKIPKNRLKVRLLTLYWAVEYTLTAIAALCYVNPELLTAKIICTWGSELAVIHIAVILMQWSESLICIYE